jgi:hypothetical protein
VWADDLLQNLRTAPDLALYFARTDKNQVGVIVSVIADNVSGGSDLADDIGALGDIATDQEEGGADLVTVQNFEQARGPRIVGAIVEGEGQLAGTRVRPDKSPAE